MANLNVKHLVLTQNTLNLAPGKHLIQYQSRGPLSPRFDDGHELKVWDFCTIISTNFGASSIIV